MLTRLFFVFLAGVFFVTGVPAHADETITIGGRSIAIPLPEGFVRIDGKDSGLDASLKSFVPAMNEGLAVFALPNEAAALVSGKGEGMTRYFMLQTLRSATGKTTTLSDFKSLRGEVRKLLGDGASAEGIKKEANDALKKSGNADISIGKLKPLGVVEEGDEFIEAAMILEAGTENAMAHVSSSIVANGKLLYAFGYSQHKGDPDVAWTKSAVKDWRSAILSANAGGTEKGGLSLAGLFPPGASQEERVGRIAGGVLGVGIVLFVVARIKKSR